MKEQIKKKNRKRIAILLSIVFIFITALPLGIALLTGNLSITGGTKIKENSWVIYFDGVRKSTDSVESTNDAKIVDSAKTKIEFDAHLEKPGDFYEFTVYTVNDGSIDAMVKSIEQTELTEEQKKYLEFNVTYDNGEQIRECDELNAGTRKRIKAVVSFKKGLDLSEYPKEDVDLNLEFAINYIQKDDACPPRPIEDTNYLTIIPNGGVYNNRTDEIRIYLNEGETYKVLTPTKGLFNFTGWTVTEPTSEGTYTFVNDIFTMGKENVVLEAEWEEGEYVARIMRTYFKTIQDALDAAKKSDWEDNTIYLLKDTTEYPINNTTDEIIFDLGGYTVTGTFTNSKGANLTVINGVFKAEDDHDGAFINNGVLKVGQDDGEVYTENSIAIIGNNYGLNNVNLNEENGSKFYFYDGYIEGVKAVTTPGHSGVPEGYFVFVEHRNDPSRQRAYLLKNPNRAIAKTLTNGEWYYYNLQDAILNSEEAKKNPKFGDDDYIIYVIRSFEAAYPLTSSSETESRIFIDLQGFNINTGEKITNNGYLNMYNKNGKTSDINVSVTFENNGTLLIDSVNITSTTDTDTIINNKSLTIKKSVIKGKDSYGINNKANGTVSLDENTIITADSEYGFHNESDDLVLNNGTIHGLLNDGTAVLNEKVTLTTNPTYTYIYPIYNNENITMNNGSVISNYTSCIRKDESYSVDCYGIYNKGTFDFNDGNVAVKATPVHNNSGTFNANSGSIQGDGTVINNYYGTTNIKGAVISSSNGTAIDGLYQTVNVYDGEVYTEGTTAINASTVNVYGGEIRGIEYGVEAITLNVENGTITSANIGVNTSDLTISGGTISGTTTGVNATGTTTITGGTITGPENGLITNNLTISGGEVTSSEGNAITINKTGTILDGKIEGAVYGVYSKGSLTIGADDGDISSTIPTIKGESYGLYIEGTSTNFYDGILKGQIDGYYGTITGTPLGGFIAEGEETINDILYQTDFIGSQENWLRVDETEFNTINAAMNAISSTGTITVIKDAYLLFSQEFVDPDNEKTVIFDLNGHTVITTQTIINSSNVTIVDSSDDHTGTFKPNRVVGLKNNNNLTINSGNFISEINAAIIENAGDMTINNGNFTATNVAITNTKNITIENITLNTEKDGIYNGDYDEKGTIIVNNGTIIAGNTGISGNGDVTFNNGTITSENIGISCSAIVNGGTIYGTNYGLNATGLYTGTYEINAGTITSKNNNAIYSSAGSITVNDGVITSENGTAIFGHLPIEINGGTIKGTQGIKNEIYCNYSCYTYPITVTGGYIEGTQSEGIELKVNTLYITGGTIKGETYGALVRSASVIGEDDGNISTTSPVLIGKINGLHSLTTNNEFYDGILKGIEAAHVGLINRIPEATMIVDDYEYINRVEYKTQYLGPMGDWLQVGDQTFNSIDAAAEVIESSGTMTVIANPYINFDQTMPEGKNILFDLNGHTITLTRSIVTAGNDTITDSSAGNGYIHAIKEYPISNTGTLKLDSGTLIADETYALQNNGTFTMDTGTISSYGGITNGGTLTINGGTVEGTNTHSINGSGNITINGGLITNEVTAAISNSGTLNITDGEIISNGGEAITSSGTVVIDGGEIKSTKDNAINSNYAKSLTINDGTITSTTSNGIQSSSPVYINGGEISGKKNGLTCSATYNQYNLEVTGGNIKGEDENGIHSTCQTTITGGVIEGGTYGTYFNSYSSDSPTTLTIGEDNGKVEIDLPILKGETYGLYIDGDSIISFYDGILKGITDGYRGVITNIPARAQLYEDVETINGIEYQVDYLLTETDLVLNVNTQTIYTNLQDAFDEVKDGETLQLIANAPIYYPVVNNISGSVTFDLNGYTISTNKNIENNGDLTIVNTSDEESAIKTSSSVVLITNNGDLSIDNITIKNTSVSKYVLQNQNTLNLNNIKVDSVQGISTSGTATITNSEIKARTTAINNTGEINITGGNIAGESYSLYSNTNSNVTINDSTLKGTYYNASTPQGTMTNSTLNGSLQNNSGTLTINESTINGVNGEGVSNNGTLNINDSHIKINSPNSSYSNNFTAITNSKNLTLDNTEIKVDNDYGYRNTTGISSSGTLVITNNTKITVGYLDSLRNYTAVSLNGNNDATISNSTITVQGGNTNYGIETSGTSEAIISNTNINANSASNTSYGIRLIDSAKVSMAETNITLRGTNNLYGIYLNGEEAVATLATGKIDARGGKTAYGVYANYGTYTQGVYSGLGIESTDVSQEDPYLYAKGTVRGIGVKKINGYFNFYDGIIWGSRYAKPETTTNVEYNYEATTYVDEETGFEYAILEYMKNDYDGTVVALLNEVYYKTVQEAINKAEAGDEILLLKSVTEDLNVEAGKNFKLNLNNHSITTQVLNNGTMNIYNGSLQSFENSTVINNGTFIMGQDDGKISTTSVRVISETLTIENNGTMVMYDGYIEGRPTINTEINKIAPLSRVHTTHEGQVERKYLQSLSEEAIKNGETDLIITIDPAGGLYNGESGIQKVYLKYQETYTLETPTKVGCTFLGWEISDENALDGNIITMNLSDITVTAKWEVTKEAVAKIKDVYFTSIESAIAAAKPGDKIEIIKDVTEDATVTPDKNITIDLGGYTVTGAFVNEGILRLLNGAIDNPNGIGLHNKKTLTLGENDGDVSIDSVRIMGTTAGLLQDGAFHFYDGYIEGTIALRGKTDSVPQGYFVYNERNTDKNVQRVYLIGNPKNAVSTITPGNGLTQYFFSLQDAIDTATVEPNEIYIIRDFEASYPLTVAEEGDILINLNSYNIQTGNEIINNGTLKIYDSSESIGSINSARPITNNGTLTIDKINIHQNTINDVIINNAGATLNLDSNTITAGDGYAINNEGTLNIEGNYTLNSNKYALKHNGEKLVLNKGTIQGIEAYKDIEINEGAEIISNSSAAYPGIAIRSAANIVINGGIINAPGDAAIYNNASDAIVTINSGTFTGKYGLYCNATNTEYILNGGTVTGTNTGAYLKASDCNFKQNGGTVEGVNYGIYTYNSRNKITINDGEVKATVGSGIYDNSNYSGSNITVISVNGGVITGSTHGIFGNASEISIENAEVITTSTYKTNYALYCYYDSICTINEGTKLIAESASGIYFSRDADLYINGGEIYAGANNSYGIYATNLPHNLTINGGKITTPGSTATAIFIDHTINFTMNDGEISSGNNGIYLEGTRNKILNINNGKISGETYGIYQNSSDVTTNIGNSNNALSSEEPFISGGLYGIYKTAGTMNFYNGKLRGYTFGYNSEFNNIRSKMDIAENKEDALENKKILTYSTTEVSEEAVSNSAKIGDGYARITYIGETNGTCTNGAIYKFDFTGDEQEFTVLCSGTYKLETWGAQGGNANTTYYGGYGGYSYGEINLTAGETLYINVGGSGTLAHISTVEGGYNGGGSAKTISSNYYSGSGGGATHIATKSGLLSSLENSKESVIIVASGGGGAYYQSNSNTYDSNGGSGGGYQGTSTNGAQSCPYRYIGGNATQSTGGLGSHCDSSNAYSPGGFGLGGSNLSRNYQVGGGAGYYGGGSGYAIGSQGGAGYTGHSRLNNTVMYGYEVAESYNIWVNNYLIERESFLQVGDQLFNNINDAVAAIDESGTIIVIKNGSLPEPSEITAGKNITLDLNGHTIMTTQAITNKGTLTITDSTAEAKGTIQNTKTHTIINQGTTTIEKVLLKSDTGTAIYGDSGKGTVTLKGNGRLEGYYGVYFDSGQTFIMESGNITATNTGAYLKAQGCNFKQDGGTVEGVSSGIRNNNAPNKITINDGEVKATVGSGIYDNSNHSGNDITVISVNGGVITGTTHGIYGYASEISIENTEVITTSTNRDNYALYCYYSICTINEGTKLIAENASGINVDDDSNITINGGEIYVGSNNGYGIYQNDGTITINNGTIRTIGPSSFGIYVDDTSSNSSTININGGEISSENIGIYLNSSSFYKTALNANKGSISGKTYGIRQVGKNAITNIGNIEDTLSIQSPTINGGTYGIYKTAGSMNFYNGRLRGYTYGYNTEFNNIRPRMDITEVVEEQGGNKKILTRTTFEVSEEATSKYAKIGNGYARITYIGETSGACTNGTIYNFDFTGGEQEFQAPCNGTYKLEVWGAQGGKGLCNGAECGLPGYGGYSYGEINLNQEEILYINVGGQGQVGSLNSCAAGGYNGGGKGTNDGGSCGNASDDEAGGGGGGATHIALASGLLSSLENNKSSVIIVAGGGGGASWKNQAGSGGGYYGGITDYTTSEIPSNENGYAFGIGENATGAGDSNGVAGGGGGFTGGYSGENKADKECGTGGTGYTGNSRLNNTVMYGYEVQSPKTLWITNYLIEREAFLQVGDQLFNNINDAVAAIESVGTIEVIKNGSLPEPSEITAGKNITLDLNGHTIMTTQAITNKGILTITDSTEEAKGIIHNIKTHTIINQGTTTIEKVLLKSDTGTAIYGDSGKGTVTLKGNGRLEGYNGVYFDSGQTFIMESGNITATNTGAYLKAQGCNFKQDGGTVEGVSSGIRNNNSQNKITINDGEVKATNGPGIYSAVSTNPNNISISVNGGVITGSTHGIDTGSANISIANAKVITSSSSRDSYAIYMGSTAICTINAGAKLIAENASGIKMDYDDDLTINGGEIYVGSNNGYGIYQNRGTITINNGTIRTIGPSSFGIYVDDTINSRTININGGEISSENIGIYLNSSSFYKTALNANKGSISGKTYGIHQVGNDVTTNIGNSEDKLSIKAPTISGGLYGIYKTSGTINFYNGRLRGYTYGYNTEFNNIRLGMDIAEEIENIPQSEMYLTYSTDEAAAEATSNTAKIGHGYARITYIGETNGTCTNGKTYNFDYTSDEQEFHVSCTGTYKLEVWGAQGGNGNTTYIGGYGGYSYGEINLTENETLYINVGGAGTTAHNGTAQGGYNGGGAAHSVSSYIAGSGGGATHIATKSGLLSTLNDSKESVIIVAGGGGGSYYYNSSSSYNSFGGSGGGYKGSSQTGSSCYDKYTGTNANQNTGGSGSYCSNDNNHRPGSFGLGGSYPSSNYSIGGGAGYYGGGSGYNIAAQGGSGYTGSTRLNNTVMYGYNVEESSLTWVSNYLVKKGEFLQVDETLFSDINEAITFISENETTGTIRLLNDYMYQTAITFPEEQNITLDLNGYNFTTSKAITNNGTLTITSPESTEKPALTTIISTNLITNNGTLNINNVEIDGYNTIINSLGGILKIDNSKIIATNQAIVSSGKFDINNTYISGTNYAIYSNTTVANTIKSSTLISNSNALYKYSTSITTINDIEIKGVVNNTKTNAVLNITKGKINGTISNTGTSTIREINISYTSDIYNDDQLINNPGILTIEDSELRITNTSSYVSNTRAINNTGTLKSTNNKLYVTNTTIYREVFGFKNAGLLTSTDDYIEVYGGDYNYGIHHYGANTATISNITINSYNSRTASYGILTNADSGDMTINGGEVNVYNSKEGYGIKVRSNVNSNNAVYNVYNNTTSKGAYVIDDGALTIESGELNAYNSQTSYGIDITSGTVTLGIEDGSGLDTADVSITNPKVSGMGSTTGIGISIGNGTLNYFDGVLIGSTSSRGETDIITLTEKGYQAVTETVTETSDDGEIVYQKTILEFLK